jgi:N-acetylglucosaminyl-diphospho-decaprenol L-rhamnosyltransferase
VAHSVIEELKECLDSIERYADLPTETILVDNASTDGTVEWVAEAHPSVKVLPLPENVGISARWKGMPLATGRYTMFLDSDAQLTPGALRGMVAALDENPAWGLLGPKLVYDDGTLQLSCRRFPPVLLPLMRRPPLSAIFNDSKVVNRHLMTDIDHERTRPVLYVLGACQIFRTDLGRRVEPLDRYFFGPDDIEWCIRIRDVGGEVVYHPSTTVIHSYRRMSSRKPISRVALRHIRDFAAFQWKYRGRRRELIRLGEELDHRALAE